MPDLVLSALHVVKFLKLGSGYRYPHNKNEEAEVEKRLSNNLVCPGCITGK